MPERIIENGVIAGNYYDKYNTKNPISRLILSRFHKTVKKLILDIAADISSITEVGCGEGYLALMISELKIAPIKACDVSSQIIEVAKRNQNENIFFYIKSIYNLSQEEDGGDLIICSEVMEHLDDPQSALQKLNVIANRYILLSIPNEPIWRMLNILRGKYLKSIGNTPGHINHWSSNTFQKLVKKEMHILKMEKSLPWIILLCKKV